MEVPQLFLQKEIDGARCRAVVPGDYRNIAHIGEAEAHSLPAIKDHGRSGVFLHGQRVAPEELTAFATQSLARYKLPKTVVLVDEMVRSPSGKPDYRWARARAMDARGLPPG